MPTQPTSSPKARLVGGRERLSTPVPVRFPPELLEEVKSAARADDRSVSA